MSRSYKKHPILKDGRSGAVGKKFANKKVRRYTGGISNGCKYKVLYPQWDIHDYVFRESRLSMMKDYESLQKEKANLPDSDYYSNYEKSTLEETINQWERWYLRK